MRKTHSFLFHLSLLATFLLTACATLQQPVRVEQKTNGQQENAVAASSFKFEPNHIVAQAGAPLTLVVRNTSVIGHNLTVKAPDGSTVVDVPLPAGQTTNVQLTLNTKGTYSFDCGKPMHSSMGMKGVIEAQ